MLPAKIVILRCFSAATDKKRRIVLYSFGFAYAWRNRGTIGGKTGAGCFFEGGKSSLHIMPQLLATPAAKRLPRSAALHRSN